MSLSVPPHQIEPLAARAAVEFILRWYLAGVSFPARVKVTRPHLTIEPLTLVTPEIGKTTTLRMLLGMVRPSQGSGHILGLRIDDEAESVRIRQRVAFVAKGKNEEFAPLANARSSASFVCIPLESFRILRPSGGRVAPTSHFLYPHATQERTTS